MSAVSSKNQSGCCWPFDSDSDSDELDHTIAAATASENSAQMTRKCPKTGLSPIVELSPGVFVTRDCLRELRNKSGQMASEKAFQNAYKVARLEMEANSAAAAPKPVPALPRTVSVVTQQVPHQAAVSLAAKKAL